jgi:DNA ligase-1
MLLVELADASRQVRDVSARSRKIALLAGVLERLAPEEVVPAVAMLAGEIRQGRIGVGWAAVRDIDVPPASTATITILDFDAAIDELATLTGKGSAGARRARLTTLLSQVTDAEAELIRRLLLGDIGQGALAGIMTDAVAKAADVPASAIRRAVMLHGDLAEVAAVAFAAGEDGIAAVGLQILRPVQPMLASTAPDVGDALAACGTSSVEWKLDGVRVQVHRARDQVRIFTRNLNDITTRLDAVASIARALASDACILDGEVIGGHVDERPELFQATMSRVGRRVSRQRAASEPEGLPLQVWFFDCLHADGEDLIDRPLLERLTTLERVAGAHRIPGTVTDDPARAAAVLEDALAAGHEGVVVKAAGSRYEAGRRGGSWRKVKPVRTLDLVVLAAEWGHGRRRGWLSNLHLGAREPAGGFVMVGKTFKGLTDALLQWQTERLQQLAVSTEGITVRVRPELVVEIALDGVQRSTRYAGGVALRFARVRRYRPDRAPADADTIDAVRALLPT